MRLLALLVALVVSLGAQQPYTPSPNPPRPPEQFPGQHDHALPPDGYRCLPQTPAGFGVDDAHVCACKRMAQVYPDGSCVLNEDGTEHIQEDPICSVYCHMDRCGCGHGSCDT